MDAQEVVALVLAASQVALLYGVFFKLGAITEGLKELGRRVEQLEQKG